ncbi:protein MIS12 homolog isoform X2 [Octopus bimaculoides]|uniref:Protein MIS12 homolog n=1 Tax=Octopus bimaculoides TaxID=37653 RepID=A0A0L8GVN0_OCTBM|nr:protein MIS12 homolog isoform X2 [Octopus bimaculoides]|eukprot:XP_014777660.1 PREDICTED: protein MIS12 homolog isoform X2 [Octopus bimaculoides]
MAEADLENMKVEEYATQFFGFTPKSFCNGVYNAVNDYIMECMKAVETYLTEKCSDSLSEDQIETGTDLILHQYMDTFNRTFERFECYVLKNIFSIPSYILLNEDTPQMHQYTPQEESLLDAEIDDLKMKVWVLKGANAKLRNCLSEMEQSSKDVDLATVRLAALQDLMSKSGVSHPHESLQLTYENIEKGKKLIEKLVQESEEIAGPRTFT